GCPEPVPVALAVAEAERVGGLELAVGLLEGPLVEEGLQSRPRRPGHVVTAERADVEILLDLRPVDDLVALLALRPQPLHPRGLLAERVHLLGLHGSDARLLAEPGGHSKGGLFITGRDGRHRIGTETPRRTAHFARNRSSVRAPGPSPGAPPPGASARPRRP